MPLFEEARIEIYVPDLPAPAYQNLLDMLELEFTYTFGGCTLQRGLNGNYQSLLGIPIQDRINLVYTDALLTLRSDFDNLSRYTDALRQVAYDALNEEAVLVVVYPVYHSR